MATSSTVCELVSTLRDREGVDAAVGERVVREVELLDSAESAGAHSAHEAAHTVVADGITSEASPPSFAAEWAAPLAGGRLVPAASRAP